MTNIVAIVIVTAYTYTGNPSASGMKLKHNSIATSEHIPFGTVIHLSDNLGDFIVTYRMPSRFKGHNRMDIYFGHDKRKAKQFGHKLVIATYAP